MHIFIASQFISVGWMRTMRRFQERVFLEVYSTPTILTSARETKWNPHQLLALER